VFGTRTARSFHVTFSKRKRQKQFIKHCKQLLEKFKKIILFVDGGPCHKGKMVEEFLRVKRKRFRLFRFPKYSPELNPTEQCWKPARKDVANRALRTVEGVKYRLRNIFDDPKNMPKMFHYLRD